MNFHSRRPLVLLAVSALLVVGAAACGDDDDSDGNAATPTAAAPNDNGNGDNGAAGEIEVGMFDNYFEPDEITLQAGQTYTIVATNEGMAIHNMAVSDTEFQSDAMVNAGDSSTFEVMFSEPGTYDFQCDYHVPDMAGTIRVE